MTAKVIYLADVRRDRMRRRERERYTERLQRSMEHLRCLFGPFHGKPDDDGPEAA